jgi:hypothetical protein
MKNELVLVVIGGGYGNIVKIGWAEVGPGDEVHLHGSRTIRRFGTGGVLALLAANGPLSSTQLLDAAVRPTEHHRLLLREIYPANPEAWSRECPCPAAWKNATKK